MRYELKTPWKNGTTHIEFEPIDFIAKLAALVPPPRAHLTRFHGIFAPNADLCAQLTPAGRGRRPAAAPADGSAPADDRTPAERRRSMTWAQRLKRVFDIDVTTCIHCGGAVRIVASIEEPKAIQAILAHFAKHGVLETAHSRPGPHRRGRARSHQRPLGDDRGPPRRQDADALGQRAELRSRAGW